LIPPFFLRNFAHQNTERHKSIVVESISETQIKTPDGKDVFIPNSIILKNPLFNYTLDGFLRYEFMVGITYDNNPTEAIRVILETVDKVEGVLKGDKKPAIMINELAADTINIRTMFWVDTFKTTRRSVHHSIRSKVMNDVVAALVVNGFSLPTAVIEVKKYEPSIPLNPKVETK
jgi:small conductance mechanosensitive channel